MIKLFTLIKKLFNVDNVESVTDEMVENYFAKQDEVVNNEEKVDEPVADEPVVDNTDVKEVVEAEVNPPTPVEPVADTPVEPVADNTDVKEPKEDEDKPQEVLTKDVISNAANNINYKDNLMTLTGDAFFTALHKHASELRKFR